MVSANRDTQEVLAAVKYEMMSMNANVAVDQEGISEILQSTDAIGQSVFNVGSTLVTQLGNLENHIGLRLDDHIRQIVALLQMPQAANFSRQVEIQTKVSWAPSLDSETDFHRGATDPSYSDPVTREAEPFAGNL